VDEHASGPEFAGLDPAKEIAHALRSEAVVPPEKPTAAQAEEAESLLRQAHLARTRGQAAQARELLSRAAMIAPGSATVQEALGDDYFEAHQYRKAAECYAIALAIEPDNQRLDRKRGDAVFFATGAAGGFESRAALESTANPKAVVVLSVMLPGVGQLVAGRVVTGVLMLIGFVGGWVVALATPGAMRSLAASLGLRSQDVEAGGGSSTAAVVGLLIASVCWLWSVFEALGRASEMRMLKKERPKPPVEKPFEL
jgi:tetratricopeptide (TPR) repeat protein